MGWGSPMREKDVVEGQDVRSFRFLHLPMFNVQLLNLSNLNFFPDIGQYVFIKIRRSAEMKTLAIAHGCKYRFWLQMPNGLPSTFAVWFVLYLLLISSTSDGFWTDVFSSLDHYDAVVDATDSETE
ncbi:hypothetical protein C8Q75DRAFT_733627 [Abortiporus biennis]|nr:hypothetical protein C8Q75DRAFT_733627 [Abortiporus biennis]